MAKTIQQLLAAPNMIGVIQSIKTGVPNPFDPAFMSLTAPTAGDSGHYFKVEGTRQTAQLVQYGSESVRRSQVGVTRQSVKLLHTFLHQLHDPIVLQNILQLDSPGVQAMGQAEIDRQAALFATLFDNLRISAVACMLCKGAVYFDGNGNLLPTSSGAVVTVDYGVPAANKDQVSTLVDVKWDTVTANIGKQLQNIKDFALRTTGYDLTTAYYGSSVAGWIMANNYTQALAAGNPAISASLLQNTLPDGLFGLKWRPAGSSFFVDADGTAQTLCAADTVILTPDPTRDWYELLEGTYLVPNALGTVSAGASAALSGVTIARGKFQYAKVLDDPVTVKHNAGDTFLPVLKVPAAIFILDVSF